MNTVFGSGAMKNIYKGETVLFQTDLQRSYLSVPKSISWNQVSLPQSWKLQDVAPAEKPKNTTIFQIQQFSTRTVSISFQRSLSQRISGSTSVLPEIQTARSSVSLFLFRIEIVNFKSRITEAKYSMETPLTEVHDDPPQSPTYSVLEPVTGKDIKNLFEQNNCTNKYLHTLGEILISKPSLTLKSSEMSTSSSPLFKPYNIPTTFTRELQMHNSKSFPLLSDLQRRIIQVEKYLHPDVPETPGVGSSATVGVLQQSDSEDDQP
ncbi:hypothetical protein BC332_02416 [Capsicum chinense]|nr:hypothetical protein BC332_02416 [Capsicum chinense]